MAMPTGRSAQQSIAMTALSSARIIKTNIGETTGRHETPSHHHFSSGEICGGLVRSAMALQATAPERGVSGRLQFRAVRTRRPYLCPDGAERERFGPVQRYFTLPADPIAQSSRSGPLPSPIWRGCLTSVIAPATKFLGNFRTNLRTPRMIQRIQVYLLDEVHVQHFQDVVSTNRQVELFNRNSSVHNWQPTSSAMAVCAPRQFGSLGAKRADYPHSKGTVGAKRAEFEPRLSWSGEGEI